MSAEIPNQVKPGDPFYAHPLQTGGGYPTSTLPLHRYLCDSKPNSNDVHERAKPGTTQP